MASMKCLFHNRRVDGCDFRCFPRTWMRPSRCHTVDAMSVTNDLQVMKQRLHAFKWPLLLQIEFLQKLNEPSSSHLIECWVGDHLYDIATDSLFKSGSVDGWMRRGIRRTMYAILLMFAWHHSTHNNVVCVTDAAAVGSSVNSCLRRRIVDIKPLVMPETCFRNSCFVTFFLAKRTDYILVSNGFLCFFTLFFVILIGIY